MRDKPQKARQFASLLIRFACVAILWLVTSAIPMTNQAQTQQQRKPTDSVPIPEPASQNHGQTTTPSFQSVATSGGEHRGLSKPIAPLPVGQKAAQSVRMSPAHRVNEVSQKLGSMGTLQTVLVLHVANGFVLLLCFFSLGIKNPWKWFQQTRMKNMKWKDDPQGG